MGWNIDYNKLATYLRNKYQVLRIYYYGGIETYNYKLDLDPLKNFPLKAFENYSKNLYLSPKEYAKLRFYKKLEEFGYLLRLKSIKHLKCEDGTTKIKANCDVDLTFDMMRLRDEFNNFVLLSGDGDFEILLRYFTKIGKNFVILANSKNTARTLKYNYAKQYRNFPEIRNLIELKERTPI